MNISESCPQILISVGGYLSITHIIPLLKSSDLLRTKVFQNSLSLMLRLSLSLSLSETEGQADHGACDFSRSLYSGRLSDLPRSANSRVPESGELDVSGVVLLCGHHSHHRWLRRLRPRYAHMNTETSRNRKLQGHSREPEDGCQVFLSLILLNNSISCKKSFKLNSLISSDQTLFCVKAVFTLYIRLFLLCVLLCSNQDSWRIMMGINPD